LIGIISNVIKVKKDIKTTTVLYSIEDEKLFPLKFFKLNSNETSVSEPPVIIMENNKKVD
jgi:hypothetical protein